MLLGERSKKLKVNIYSSPLYSYNGLAFVMAVFLYVSLYTEHISFPMEIPLKHDDDFTKVIPTAWMVAFRRTFTDIPYSQAVFEKLEALRKAKGLPDIAADLKKPELAPQFEARHKLIDKLLLAQPARQVLEIAAGFSSRGMVMATEKELRYVEFDLPEVIVGKQEIVNDIFSDEGKITPAELFFEAGNALSFEDLERAVAQLDPKRPLTIINEGLLRYLTFAEKAMVARNVKQLLERFGGAWITSDISLRKIFNMENALMKDHVKKISELTGKDIAKNRFETEDEAREFFESFGFTIERHSFMEVLNELVSPQRLSLPASEVNYMLEDAVVYVMTLV